MMDVAWIKERKRERGLNDDKIAVALGVERSVANKVVNGRTRMSPHRVDEMARLLGVSRNEMLARAGILAAPAEAAPDLPVVRNASTGETVSLQQLDLSFSMGTGTSIDDYIESEPVEFDLGMLRAITRAEPSRLRLARGVGDSMFPTLQSADRVMIDTTQTVLNQTDRIWAVSIHGAGAIKRLRTIGNGKVLVMSDNRDVPPQEIDADDLIIGGRVIWLARDI